MTAPIPGPEFVLQHRGFVRALARELVFDAELARDVEQETWLAALTNVPREGGSPRAWLAGIVRKVALKTWRSKLRRGDRELVAAREERAVPTPAELLERESLRREIVEAVVALEEPWREALIARYFEDLTPEQAAQRIGVPLETLRTRLKRGRELLRDRLTRRRGESGSNWALALVGAWKLEPPSYTAVAWTLIKEILVVSATQKALVGLLAVVLLAASLWTWKGETAIERQVSNEAVAGASTAVEPLQGTHEISVDPMQARAVLPRAAETPAAPLVASRFGSLRLHVIWAEDKTPAAGVGMRIHQRGADDPFRESCDARTDLAGEVFVQAVFAGQVTVKLDRGEWVDVDVVAGIDNLATLEIPTGYSVTGTVVDFDGRPFAGAEIYAQIFGGSYEGCVVAHSAADGAFAIRGLSPHTSELISARAADRTPTRQHALMEEPGAKVVLRLAFEAPGGAFTGHVLAPDGTPLAGARVLIGKERDTEAIVQSDGSVRLPPAAQCTLTNERGEFHFDGVGDGRHPVQARAKGFAPWKGEALIVAGRTSMLDVVLGPGASLSGVARDEEGSALADVEIWVSAGVSFASSFRRTKADGSFEMRDLPLGELKLEADSETHGFSETTMIGVSGGELQWDPVLSSGTKLRVQLVAPGRELAGWRLNVEAQPGVLDAYADYQATEADGRAVFINVPDVELRLSLRAPGETFPRAVLTGLRARDGDVVIQPDPALEPTIHLSGRIVGPDGLPMGGVRVHPTNANLFYPPYDFVDAATGRFEFGPLPAGDWTVHGFMPGFAPVHSAAVHVDSGVRWDFGDLQLQRGGTVVARLSIEGVAGDAKPTVELRDATGETSGLVVEGEFARSAPVAPGHYTLIARGPGFATREIELDVKAEQETQVSLTLRKPL